MKRKIRIILISIIIVIVPLIFIIKRIIAVDIQGEAQELINLGETSQDYIKAIEKSNTAIMLAPRAYMMYVTKAQALEKLKRYREAMTEYQKIFKFKDDYAEGYVLVGIDYERIGLKDSALIQYKFALDKYNDRIIKYKNNKNELYLAESNKVFVHLMLNDSLEAKNEFQQLKIKYPKNIEMIEENENTNWKEKFGLKK